MVYRSLPLEASKNYNRKRDPGLWAWLKDWGALLRDILTDISMIPVWDREIGIRPLGFLKAANDVVDEIQARVHMWEPIDIIGHTLGAVAGALAAEKLAKRGYWIRNVIMFGAPRCGSLTFINSTNCSTRVRSFRFGRDIVTQVPLLWRTPAQIERIGIPGDRLDDHSMENYAAWLRTH